jgi:hypothetical protein
MRVRKASNRQSLDIFRAAGHVAPQFILIQKLPGCILRLGSIYLRHLGETSNVDASRLKNGTPHHTGSLSTIHVKKMAAWSF